MFLDFTAGLLGGAAGVIVGHPFDTVKVRLQAQAGETKYRGTIDCFVKIIKHETVTGFYKGITSPLTGLAFINAVVFGVYGNILRKFKDPEAIRSQVAAGAVAGCAQSIIACPMELVKLQLQLQTQNQAGQNRFHGAMDCLFTIYKECGLKGFLKGLSITTCRDTSGFAIYFGVYETFTRWIQRHRFREPNVPELLLAGGMAGMTSWFLNYPLDVIKTRYQCDASLSRSMTHQPALSLVETIYHTSFMSPKSSMSPTYANVLDCATQCYKQEGYKVFTRGLVPTLMRAFPTNAVTFMTVAMVYRLYSRHVLEQAEESCAS